MPSFSVRRTLVPMLAALVLVGTLSACGTSSGSAAPTVPASDPAPASPSTSASAPVPDAPDTSEIQALLVAQLGQLVDPSLSPQQHAAEVWKGDDLVPTFAKLDAFLSQGAPVTFAIESTSLTGNKAEAAVRILNAGAPLENTVSTAFVLREDRWRITRTGACSLIAVSGLTCPAV